MQFPQMLLTPKALAQISACTTGDKSTTTPTLAPVRNGIIGPSAAVSIQDISAGGIAIVYSPAVEIADRFVVSLPRERKTPLRILCVLVGRSGWKYDKLVLTATFEQIVDEITAVAA
jgi:hypothetical protein